MKDKQETAVEWLMKEISKTYIFNQHDFDMFKQAKEMENAQKAHAFNFGMETQRAITNKKNEQ
jgi:hypothetical protein